MKLYKTHLKTKSALNLSNTENTSKKMTCYLLRTFCSIVTVLTHKNVCYLKEILQDAIHLQF